MPTEKLHLPQNYASRINKMYLGFEHWFIPEKIHTFTTEDMLENLMGGGLTALEIQL